MAEPGQTVSLGLRRPGRALTALLVLIAVLGIGHALLSTWAHVDFLFDALLCDVSKLKEGQLWRILTSGLLTSPGHYDHLIFTLLGLYFLGATLEEAWGGWRFLRFFATSVVLGNLLVILVGLTPLGDMQPRFAQPMMFGAGAAITSIAAAWGLEYGNQQLLLFFVLPVRGRMLFWLTVGFCVLNLIYPVMKAEGVMAPFAGLLTAVLFSGSPSPARRAYLRLKLALLRRRSSSLRVDMDAPGGPVVRKSRGATPPLRVLSGGLDEALTKRKPPKDKRYLN
jgi:membrane associated rhomboid family serine protease